MKRKWLKSCITVFMMFLFPVMAQASLGRINHDYFPAFAALPNFASFETAYFNENYSEAKAVLDLIIAENPEEVYLYYIRANLSWELRDFASVRADLDEYLTWQTTDIEGYKLNMMACIMLGEEETALDNCRMGLALNEQDEVLQKAHRELSASVATNVQQESGVNLSAQSILGQMQEVFDMVNEERRKAGINTLQLHDGLNQAAMERSEEITKVFSHTRPNGESFATMLDVYHVDYQRAGENIASGMTTATEVMEGWMESPGHRANILEADFRYIGVGYVEKNGAGYWTQLFIR